MTFDEWYEDRGDGTGSLFARPLQRVGGLPTSDRGQLCDFGRLTLHGGSRLQPGRERGLRCWLRHRLGDRDRGPRSNSRETPIQRRPRAAPRVGGHVHPGGSDVDRIHGLFGDSALARVSSARGS